MFERISSFNVMWILVFFDLPTETKKERKAALDFRNQLLKDGFGMFQLSIYVRHCMSRENMDVHINRVKNFLPDRGFVAILTITDKQFETMELFECAKPKPNSSPSQQLEMF